MLQFESEAPATTEGLRLHVSFQGTTRVREAGGSAAGALSICDLYGQFCCDGSPPLVAGSGG